MIDAAINVIVTFEGHVRRLVHDLDLDVEIAKLLSTLDDTE